MFKTFIFFLLSVVAFNQAYCAPSMRENLEKAKPGDYIVAAVGKNYTLLHLYDKQGDHLKVQEIVVPMNRATKFQNAWPTWLRQGAPNNTCWIKYDINTTSGNIEKAYSVNQKQWASVNKNASFLPVLLNLQLTPVPAAERRRTGAPPSSGTPDFRPLWQPKMVISGKTVPNVNFSAWRTRWPNDSSELAGKTIELFLPEDNQKYPAYFPYWLQIRGDVAGKATIHVVDSGRGLNINAS